MKNYFKQVKKTKGKIEKKIVKKIDIFQDNLFIYIPLLL